MTLSLILGGTVFSVAQPYYFRHYQVENGLSNNTIFSGIQDETGFLWFGTKEGLNRFDGYHFKVFKFHAERKDWAEPELVYALFNDPKGTLWVGTQAGMFAFDKKTEKLVPYFQPLTQINAIQADKSGNLWFISGNTICRYNEATKQLTKFDTEKYFRASSLCLAADNQMWFSSTDGFLHHFDNKTGTFSSHNVYAHSPGFLSCYIEKILPASNGSIYIGTSCQGIKEFNTADGSYQDIFTYNADKTPVYVRDILEYSPTEFWFATESGIFIHDRKTNSFTNLRKKSLDPYSLNDNAVYTLCRDKEGGVWAGTFFGGVNYYAKQYSAFQKFFADNQPGSLKGSAVREIIKDKYGQIWIGTEDAGLNKLDPSTGKIINYAPDGKAGSIIYSNLHGLMVDDDELWIGTHEHGLDVMNIKTARVIHHFNEGRSDGELHNNFIISMLRTRDSTIYVGTGRGLHVYNRKTRSFSRVPELPDYIFVSSVIETHDGTIWVGTHSQGLFWFNKQSGKNGQIRQGTKPGEELTAGTVNSILEDSKNNLWIGTEGGGLVKLSGDRKTFKAYTDKDGLPSNFIFKTLEDKAGKIWFSSSKGLIMLDPVTDKLKTFTRSSGLLSDQFNYNSGYADADGRLYFGSVKGLIGFDPLKIISPAFEPPVFITGIQVKNKELDPAIDSLILDSAVTHSREIRLAHDQSSFNIHFAALSFVSPDLTKYRYIMNGLDKEWTELPGNRQVYFTDLSPGKYTFRVQAATNGIWAGNEASIDIIITPPFWATTWAFLLYAFVIATIAYVIIKTLHDRAQEKKEKEIYAAKIEFFTNVAHEIRTPLTLIKGPVENISEAIGDMPDVKEDIHTLERNTDRLISLVSGVLDFRKTETKGFSLDFSRIDLNAAMEENFLDFKPLAAKRNLDFTIELPAKNIVVNADQEALDKIISNLLSNAVKYARSKTCLKLEAEHSKAMIIVCSDGFKIPENISEKIFEPFYRMKETSKQKGTGIGLALARSLAELHNGKLVLDTKHPELNVFVLELPFNNNINLKKISGQSGHKI
ncbi:MAG: two-component regulator propeller domain-containing protein [Flavitalea sp.]